MMSNKIPGNNWNTPFYSFLLVLLLLICCFSGKSATISPDGELVFDSRYCFRLIYFTPEWKPTILKHKLKSASRSDSANIAQTEGSSNGFRIRSFLQSSGNEKQIYTVQVNAENVPVHCALLCGAIDLKLDSEFSIEINNKKINIPKDIRRKYVYNGQANRVTITDPTGKLTFQGNFHIALFGSIPGKTEYYQLRFMPRGKRPQIIHDWKLQLEISEDFSKTNVLGESIDLSRIFNRALKDEVAGDGKGGWTDQGPKMDLRSFKPGLHKFLNLPFHTPAGEKACLILRSGEKTPSLPLGSQMKNPKYLYLLHASAWPPPFSSAVGTISITFADGSRTEFPVRAGIDVGNWYNPLNFENAYVIWRFSLSPTTTCGLYLSAFPLKKEVEKISFSGQSKMWMILGAAFADNRIRFPSKNYVAKLGKSWMPINFSGQTVPGSPLDFSKFFREKPAGKFGFITTDSHGHFVFEQKPKQRIRLFGTNLVGSANVPPKDVADKFVETIKRLGYNSVRLHHFENFILDSQAVDSVTLDPDKLDRMQYLFARLKEEGFYICIDLYASRMLRPGDNIPELEVDREYSMKNLICVSPAALENWKTFAKKLLTVQNKYTGMSFLEDPALYALNLVNENALIIEWNGVRTNKSAAEIIRNKFGQYLHSPEAPKHRNQYTENGLFIEFLLKLQAKCMDQQIRFLRRLGLKALITDLNHHNHFTLSEISERLDFVDNHQYWDHPTFPGRRWRAPFLFHNSSTISKGVKHPGELMPTRIFTKPFTVTEFNFCMPNIFRVECPTLVGGYASLQDWDGLYRFAWSHGLNRMKDSNQILTQFDTVNNIQAQMADRIIALLFLRQDVNPAKSSFAAEFDIENVRSLTGNSRSGRYPKKFEHLGLFAKIGNLSRRVPMPGIHQVSPELPDWSEQLSEAARTALKQFYRSGKIVSETKEIVLDQKNNYCTISTPRSEVITASGSASAQIMRLNEISSFQTISIHSLDHQELKKTNKIILIHLADISNSNMIFDDTSRRVLRNWGNLPQMLERGSCQVQLSLPRMMNIYPLKLDGTPVNTPLPVQYQNGILSFRIATDTLPDGCLAYLLQSAD